MEATTVLGVPLYTFTKHNGMGEGPRKLRKAGLLKAVGGEVVDGGDLKVACPKRDSEEGGVKNLDTFRQATAQVYEGVRRLGTEKALIVGGECSATVGALAGLSQVFRGKPGMLWMDAHGDFNTPGTSPSGYIGGMCLAMACGRGPSLGDEIERSRPLLTEERLVHVGSRALDPPEVIALTSSPAKLFTAEHLRARGAAEVAGEAARHLANRSDWIVCHLDVDVLDPRNVPSVSYPTPGGLAVHEVVAMISALKRTEKLRAVELAAYNPAFDRDGSSARIIVDLVRLAEL